MPRDQQHEDENDPDLAEIHRLLDEGEESLDRYGPVSAEHLHATIEAVYERHRREVEEEAAQARSKVG